MSTVRHTPGPHFVDRGIDEEGHYIYNIRDEEDDAILAEIHDLHRDDAANAQLFASASDMLIALKELIDELVNETNIELDKD